MAIGAATTLGAFQAALGMDESDYTRGILQAQGVTSVFGQTFATFVTNPLLGSIDLFKRAAGGAIELGGDVLGTAERLSILSAQTGASTELLQALELAFDNAGKRGEQAGKGVLVLARNLEDARRRGGDVADIFAELGVNIERVRGADQLLAAVLAGLGNIRDEGRRSALAMKLFGEEAGPNMVAAVGTGANAVRDLVEEGRRLNAVWGGEAVRNLANLEGHVETVTVGIDQLKRAVVAGFLSGFAEEFLKGSEGAGDLAQELGANLVPQVRDLGEELGTASKNAAELLKSVNDLASAIQAFPETMPLMLRGMRESGPLGQLMAEGMNGGAGTPLERLLLRHAFENVDANAFSFSMGMR